MEQHIFVVFALCNKIVYSVLKLILLYMYSVFAAYNIKSFVVLHDCVVCYI